MYFNVFFSVYFSVLLFQLALSLRGPDADTPTCAVAIRTRKTREAQPHWKVCPNCLPIWSSPRSYFIYNFMQLHVGYLRLLEPISYSLL